jgi:hypothetical protein
MQQALSDKSSNLWAVSTIRFFPLTSSKALPSASVYAPSMNSAAVGEPSAGLAIDFTHTCVEIARRVWTPNDREGRHDLGPKPATPSDPDTDEGISLLHARVLSSPRRIDPSRHNDVILTHSCTLHKFVCWAHA